MGNKRFIVGLTALMTAISLLSFSVMAKNSHKDDYTEGYLYYTLEDSSITITGYFGSETEVTVPNMIAGNPVNTIGTGAFTGTSVKKLNLPDTITTIEEGAVGLGIEVVYNSNTAESSGGGDADQKSDNDNKSGSDGNKNSSVTSGGSSEDTKANTDEFDVAEAEVTLEADSDNDPEEELILSQDDDSKSGQIDGTEADEDNSVTQKSGKKGLLICIAACVLVAAFAVIMVLRKRRR